MAKVKNINGTSNTNCTCGSWLKHWEKFSGQTIPTLCTEKTCTEKDLIGAHVQKADGYDDKWYIIPLCSKHNQSKSVLEVSDAIKMVLANKRETCEKPTKY